MPNIGLKVLFGVVFALELEVPGRSSAAVVVDVDNAGSR